MWCGKVNLIPDRQYSISHCFGISFCVHLGFSMETSILTETVDTDMHSWWKKFVLNTVHTHLKSGMMKQQKENFHTKYQLAGNQKEKDNKVSKFSFSDYTDELS